jgi:hypothetical protein
MTLSRRGQLWVDILGTVVFLLPTCAILAWLSWPFFMQSFVVYEHSSNAGGLLRWPIKLVLPVGFTLVALQVPAELDMVGPCSTLDPAVLQAVNIDALNTPLPPCYRTATANISLPIQDAPVPINLREAQFVFNFDDPSDPQAVQNGLIYGFLTQASAEATSLKILGNDLVLWPLMSPTAMCEMMYSDLLPAVDMLMDGMTPLTGVWMAVNFTATRIELLPPP